MGSNCTGEVEATVVATGMGTFFGTTANMIQSVDELGHLQKILLQIMFFLIVLSFLLCGICFAYLWAEGEDVDEALSFTVVLLIASIPVGHGGGGDGHHGAGLRQLVAGRHRLGAVGHRGDGGHEHALLGQDGHATLNKMVIQEDCPTFQPNVTRRRGAADGAAGGQVARAAQGRAGHHGAGHGRPGPVRRLHAAGVHALRPHAQAHGGRPAGPRRPRVQGDQGRAAHRAGALRGQGPHPGGGGREGAGARGAGHPLAGRGAHRPGGSLAVPGRADLPGPPAAGHQADDRARARVRRGGEDDHGRPRGHRARDRAAAGHG
ncbi:unnamed protein product, partial [Heterosigma akashiwo]